MAVTSSMSKFRLIDRVPKLAIQLHQNVFLLFLICYSMIRHIVPNWKTSNTRRIHLQSLKNSPLLHEVQSAFISVVQCDGGGEWPPVACHRAWPLALQPYRGIWSDIAANLTAIPDERNLTRIRIMRLRLRTLLSEVNLAEVEALLSKVEHGGNAELSPKCYNGFYSCLAFLRHAYRWGMNPIVMEAQLEKTVALPDELSVPWQYIQRHYGFTSDSGTLMSNILLNLHQHEDEPVYMVNTAKMPQDIQNSKDIQMSERNFYLMFHKIECLSVPIYRAIIQAIVHHHNSDDDLCLKELQDISESLRLLFGDFSQRMHDSKMARSVWMQFVQGFHAWGAGTMHTGTLVTFDGLSGGHVLVIQALDAFIGLEPLFDEQQLENYVSAHQRQFISLIRKHNFRGKLKHTAMGDKLEPHFCAIAKQLKFFRATHRARALSYLNVAAPERLFMTTTLSARGATDSDPDCHNALRDTADFLDKRLSQTK